jgi:membrane protein implicated in regulation of membrane protease activity
MEATSLIAVHNYWIIFGVLLILIETFTVPGIGFLFAGLGAFTTSFLISFELISSFDYLIQATSFLASSVLFALVLFKPLTKTYRKSHGYKNIIGSEAVVYGDKLVTGKLGHVRWSGTIMNAMLSNKCTAREIQVGETVRIEALEGNILIVNSQ